VLPSRQRSDPGVSPGWSLHAEPLPGGGILVLAAGEFDIAAVPDVHRVISQSALAQVPPARVVIDLSAVSFLDAAMLSALVTERRALLGAGGDLHVRGVTEWSLRIIDICGLRETLGL
jgi:anti-anti-sigma factor